jgi:uncharacterized protein (TIGR03435 family)
MTIRETTNRTVLLLVMRTLIAVIAKAGTAGVVCAQSPQFEVASIKPCRTANAAPSGRQGGSGAIKSSPGRLNAECVTVEDLIREAWLRYPDGQPLPTILPGVTASVISRRLLNAPIEGGPGWLHSERYTIEAATQGTSPESVIRGPMLQTLPESRFQLQVHEAPKQIPVYELTVASGGPHLQPALDGNCISRDKVQVDSHKPAPEDRSAPTRPCGTFEPSRRGGVDMNGTTIANFCTGLSAVLDRDVMDNTGIAGLFDIHFDVDRAQPVADPPDPAEHLEN